MSVLAPRQASDITLPFSSEGRWKVAVSEETNDQSVNFVRTLGPGQMIEARYVRRTADYVAGYVSSHLGCAHACRFCHLTQTAQTDMMPVGAEGYLEQAAIILEHYARQIPKAGRASKINYNFMARSEPLSNGTILTRVSPLVEAMSRLAGSYGLKSNFNFSTILPVDSADFDLKTFAHLPITLYYSLYSLDKKFRKRWLPNAMDPLKALDRLADYQQKSGREIVFHWALIKGGNDKAENAHAIAKEIKARGLFGRFNLVEYNAYSKRQGEQAGRAAHTYTTKIMGKCLGEGNARRMALFWGSLNMLVLFLVALLCFEAPLRRTDERFSFNEPAAFRARGQVDVVQLADCLLSGARIICEDPGTFTRGEQVEVSIPGVGWVRAEVMRLQGTSLGLRFNLEASGERDRLIAKLFTDQRSNVTRNTNALAITLAMFGRIVARSEKSFAQPAAAVPDEEHPGLRSILAAASRGYASREAAPMASSSAPVILLPASRAPIAVNDAGAAADSLTKSEQHYSAA